MDRISNADRLVLLLRQKLQERARAASSGTQRTGAPATPHKGLAGMPCQDCLAAAMAAVTPAPVVAVQPVAYEIARADHAPALRLLAPRARAPPRPPGQGPPTA